MARGQGTPRWPGGLGPTVPDTSPEQGKLAKVSRRVRGGAEGEGGGYNPRSPVVALQTRKRRTPHDLSGAERAAGSGRPGRDRSRPRNPGRGNAGGNLAGGRLQLL